MIIGTFAPVHGTGERPARRGNMLYYPQLQNGCKLNGEMLYILDYVVSGRSEFDMIRENRIAKQKEAFRAVFGKWRDSRSTDEIVSEIEGARTPGRKVEL